MKNQFMHTSAPFGLSQIAKDFHNVCVYIASKYVHLSYATQINKYTKAEGRMRSEECEEQNKSLPNFLCHSHIPFFPSSFFLFFISDRRPINSASYNLFCWSCERYKIFLLLLNTFIAASYLRSPHSSFTLFIDGCESLGVCTRKVKLITQKIPFFSDAGWKKKENGRKQQQDIFFFLFFFFIEFSFLIIFLFMWRCLFIPCLFSSVMTLSVGCEVLGMSFGWVKAEIS